MAFTGRQPGRSVGVERLIHARDIALAGDVYGSTSFDATANVSIDVTIQDDSHNHIIDNVDGLQTALDTKAPIANLTTHTSNTSNPHIVTKTQVGLGSVDNTADSAKNVLSATKLTTARTIDLSGDVTGSVSFDGSANTTINTTVADDSHNHIVENVDGLQAALDAKAPLASPALTGTPVAPTATTGTNTTQIATTAFVNKEITDTLTFTTNNITVFKNNNGWYSYQMSRVIPTGGWPSCPLKLDFWRVGRFKIYGCLDYKVTIHSAHRGMYGTSGYYENIILEGGCYGDQMGFRYECDRPSASNIGLLSQSKSRINFTNNGVGFETLAEIGTGWLTIDLCLATYPSCGADKMVVVKVEWIGSANDIIPISNYYQITSTDHTLGPEILNKTD